MNVILSTGPHVVCFDSWLFHGIGDNDSYQILGFVDDQQKIVVRIAQNIFIRIPSHLLVHFMVHLCFIYDVCSHTRLGSKC